MSDTTQLVLALCAAVAYLVLVVWFAWFMFGRRGR